MKVGRVAIITRGRYAGKKVRHNPSHPLCCRRDRIALEEDKIQSLGGMESELGEEILKRMRDISER